MVLGHRDMVLGHKDVVLDTETWFLDAETWFLDTETSFLSLKVSLNKNVYFQKYCFSLVKHESSHLNASFNLFRFKIVFLNIFEIL